LVSLYPISVFSSKFRIILYSIKLGYYTRYYNTIPCLIQIEELNQTAQRIRYEQRIRLKSVHPWASAEIFPGGEMSKLCLSFSGCWQCKSTFTKRFTLYTPLVCAGRTSFSIFAWNAFYTSAIRNALSYHKLPNIHFFEHFYKYISHNLKDNGQNNMSGEMTRKLDTLAKHSRKTVSSSEK